MSQWIQHLSEPQHLLLTWEPPLSVADRTRWIVGQLSHCDDGATFRYLVGEEFAAANKGRSLDDLKAAGYLGYPAFDVRTSGQATFQDHVLEAFLRRIPPFSRSDFSAYLAHFRIPPSTAIGPLALLGATEARLPGDGFSLIDPFDPNQESCDAVIEVAGHRHYQTARTGLALGQALRLVSEPDHPHDSNAVRIDAAGIPIGYVNRVQAPVITRWLETRNVEASLLRLNGSASRPRAFVFVSVRPKAELRAA